MARNKTVATAASVDEFVGTVEDPQKQRDCRDMIALMRKATGHEP